MNFRFCRVAEPRSKTQLSPVNQIRGPTAKFVAGPLIQLSSRATQVLECSIFHTYNLASLEGPDHLLP